MTNQELKEVFEKSGFNFSEPVNENNAWKISFGMTTPSGEEWKETLSVIDLDAIPTEINTMLEDMAEKELTESEQWKFDNLLELYKRFVNPNY